MRIQHNIMAMNAYRNYTNNTSALSKNLEKLSSGYKINRAGDDAAGLAISEKMRAQITGLEGAQKNAKDGISLVQTAEGALTEVHDMLNRMYSLAEQSANGTYADEVDRENLQREINALSNEINRIADTANFNDIYLFKGGDNDETVTNVTATLDQNNLAKLGEATGFAFAEDVTDEQKAAFVEALGESGAAIQVGIKAAVDTGLAANDTVKLSSLPTGYTFKYTDQTDATVTVADGTAIEVGTGDRKLDAADVGDAVTFDVYDADDNKIGTFTVDVSSLTGITTGNEQTTTVTLAAAAEEAAAEPTVEAATVEKGGAGKDHLGAVSLTFADNATDEQRTALNEALAGASINVTTKDTGSNTTLDANDTIKLDGLSSEYTYKFVAADGTEVTYTDGNEITYAAGNTNGADKPDVDDASLVLNIYSKDGTTKLGSLTIGTPTALANNATEATTLTFTAPTTEDKPAGTTGGDVKPVETKVAGGGSTIKLQIGADGSESNMLEVKIGGVNMKDLNLETVDITTGDNARAALQGIKNAINQVSSIRGDLGATQNRLEHTINNLSVMQENIQDAESTIRDTDIADEMMNYTKNNILIQSAQAMLAQANQVPQGVLQLLQ